MHLTNYSVNKRSGEFVEQPDNILEPNNASGRTFEAFWKQITIEHGAETT